jgi:hypothetical protein
MSEYGYGCTTTLVSITELNFLIIILYSRPVILMSLVDGHFISCRLFAALASATKKSAHKSHSSGWKGHV